MTVRPAHLKIVCQGPANFACAFVAAVLTLLHGSLLQVRSETSIASGAVSVSSAAAELAQLKLPSHNWSDAKVCAASVGPVAYTRSASCDAVVVRQAKFHGRLTLALHLIRCLLIAVTLACSPTTSHLQVCVIGAGKMSRLLLKHMAAKGCTRLILLNRSTPRAEQLAAEFPEVCQSALRSFSLPEYSYRVLGVRLFIVADIFAPPPLTPLVSALPADQCGDPAYGPAGMLCRGVRHYLCRFVNALCCCH